MLFFSLIQFHDKNDENPEKPKIVHSNAESMILMLGFPIPSDALMPVPISIHSMSTQYRLYFQRITLREKEIKVYDALLIMMTRDQSSIIVSLTLTHSLTLSLSLFRKSLSTIWVFNFPSHFLFPLSDYSKNYLSLHGVKRSLSLTLSFSHSLFLLSLSH